VQNPLWYSLCTLRSRLKVLSSAVLDLSGIDLVATEQAAADKAAKDAAKKQHEANKAASNQSKIAKFGKKDDDSSNKHQKPS
jgi:hypothetical protein